MRTQTIFPGSCCIGEPGQVFLTISGVNPLTVFVGSDSSHAAKPPFHDRADGAFGQRLYACIGAECANRTARLTAAAL
jgi:hypothetical protein